MNTLVISRPDMSSNSLDIVFHRTELFDFNEIQLTNYFYHRLCLVSYPERHYHTQVHLTLSLMLCSKGFIVLHLYLFRSMIHFDLTFVTDGMYMSQFILLHVDGQLF